MIPALPAPALDDDDEFWSIVYRQGRPADTVLADLETPWSARATVADADLDDAYWDWVRQEPSPPRSQPPPDPAVLDDEWSPWDNPYWQRIDVEGRPLDSFLADIESPWPARPAIPDADLDDAYWDWIRQQEPDPEDLAAQEDLDDEEIAPAAATAPAEAAAPAVPAAPPAASTPAAGPSTGQEPGLPGEQPKAPLAPMDPDVLARLRESRTEPPAAVDYAALNPQQLEAVQCPPGPVIVVAGPGTGKTRVIAHRIAYLVETGAADPATILAVTFTRQAARELRARLAQALTEETAGYVTACTFHSLGYQVLRAEVEHLDLDLPKNFSVYGNGSGDAILRKALGALGLDERRWPLDRVRAYVAGAKSRLQDPAELLQAAGERPLERSLAQIYQAYQEELRAAHAVDYEDLLALPLRILYGDGDIRAYWRERFRHILVDEFQDTNPLQYELVRVLAAEHTSLTAVCSPAQTIYTWRGADGPRALARFQADFPAAHQVVLGQHYRCSQTILTAAQSLIQGRGYGEQALQTDNEAGPPIVIAAAATAAGEVRFVVQEIGHLVAQGYQYRDIAILYRTKEQGRDLERVLLAAHVPYLLIGERRFFNRPEVRVLLAYLRLAYNLQDEVAVGEALAGPPCRMGPKFKYRDALADRFGGITLQSLQEAKADGLPQWVRDRLAEFLAFITQDLPAASPTRTAGALLEYVLDQPWYAAWLERSRAGHRQSSLRTLQLIAGRYDHRPPADSLAEFLDEIREMEESDLWDVPLEDAQDGQAPDDPGSVILSTIHAAKGREYPVVFVVGVEDGLLPHARSMGTTLELEEERRLAYVALTRAQQRLYLSFAQARESDDGPANPHRPSRFLSTLPRETWQLQQC